MLKISQNRPGGKIVDRSLEGFITILSELKQQVHSVMDEQAKQELNGLIVPFIQQMNAVLDKHRGKGTGFSPNFQPPNGVI